MGAAGAGVTTLGRAVADALVLPHHDTDDYFWQPTTPPFQRKRAVADRLRLMHEIFVPRPGWVLSGTTDDWGDPIIPLFDLVVFVFTPTEVRLHRLRAREARRLGAETISPSGWRHQETEEFIDFASRYDAGNRASRNLERDEAWLAKLPCRVLRVDGTRPTYDLAREVVALVPS